jgi:hypothetical protein
MPPPDDMHSLDPMQTIDPLNFFLRFPVVRWSPSAPPVSAALLSAVSKTALECFAMLPRAVAAERTSRIRAFTLEELRSLAPEKFKNAVVEEPAGAGRIIPARRDLLWLAQACSESGLRERIGSWVAFRMNVSIEATGRALERLASRPEKAASCSMSPLERAILKTGLEFLEARSPGGIPGMTVAGLDSKELLAVLSLQSLSLIRRTSAWKCAFRSEEGIAPGQMLKWIRLRTGVQLTPNPWLQAGLNAPVLKRHVVWDSSLPVPVIDRLGGSVVDSQQASDAEPAPLRQSEIQLISVGANAAIRANDPILWCTEMLLRKGADEVNIEAMEPEAAHAFAAHCCQLMERYRHPRLHILCEDLGTTFRGTCQRLHGIGGDLKATIKLNVRFLHLPRFSEGISTRTEYKLGPAALLIFTHEFAHALVALRRPESAEDRKFLRRLRTVRRKYLAAIRPHLLRLRDIHNDLGTRAPCFPWDNIPVTRKAHRVIMDNVLAAVGQRGGTRRAKNSLRRELQALDAIYLGTYAEKNLDEFMAVAFTEYHCRQNPSPYAIEVGYLMDEYFGRAIGCLPDTTPG